MTLLTAPVGELTEILSGFAFKSEQFNNSGEGLPLIRIRDVVEGASDTYYSGDYKSEFLIKNGDALIGMDGQFNLACWRGGPALLNQRVCKIKATDERLDQSYLLRVLPLALKEIEDRTPFVTVKHLSVKSLREIEISLPPLSEQRRIAAILDKADALRAKRRETIAKLDQLLKSVFLEMFGDATVATTSVAELAPSAGAIRTGPFGSQLLHSEFVEHGIAVLGIDNAVTNAFAWAKPRFITTEKYSQLSRYRVNPGDVLITIMGTCGRCAVVPDDMPTAINTKHLCCISLDRTRCEPEFLHSYFLLHPIARNYLESRAKGAIMAGLNMGIIKELPVVLPSLEKQRHFVSIKRALGRQIEQTQAQENRFDELFAGLQQNAFAGTL
ncbi:restriction endonuclease subunit S [Pseudomonas sp. LG1E9]|uniref:restriction endonuclease subunit S n=1 Tax=Pseudomonas sp. LG1E9 TaxID=2219057 RepID=UPI000DD3FA47|nr:restriction endonuclease subunit S [Pseudomonas sp. LG1E9]